MRFILLGLLFVLCGCQQSTPLGEALEGKPIRNVIVISFDALRADALGVYGYDRGTSPNIDRWAQRAVVFDRAYASAQATPTSFAGAFTGRYPFRVFRGWQLEDEATLAASFKAAGYHTAFLANNIQVMAERGFGEGFDHYVEPQAEDHHVESDAGVVPAPAGLAINKLKAEVTDLGLKSLDGALATLPDLAGRIVLVLDKGEARDVSVCWAPGIPG